jgi:AmmeMemoRadiSam system protein B
MENDGQSYVCLRDPENFNDKTLFIPSSIFFIVNLLDGNHDILDIQAEFMRKFNDLIFREQIESIIQQLDDNLFLESERFAQFFQQLKQDFSDSPLRKARHAGNSYPDDPAALESLITSFFNSPEGPGPIEQEKCDKNIVKGIIAPHIDLRFGGPCFAWAYKELAQAPTPELFIVFGTAHAASRNLFTLTQKDFETPLGIVKTDKEFIQDLISRYDHDLFADEMTHRTEHTIEFQLLFLQYLYQMGGPKEIKIVPVLCGSFHEMILSGISPWKVPQFEDFINAMETTMNKRNLPICLISSADLAHVGLRYGDPSPPSPAALEAISSEDLNFLEYAAKNDPESLFQLLNKDSDRRRICGFPPIYTMLNILDNETRGTLLKYNQWSDPQGTSAVTFASMVFNGG